MEIEKVDDEGEIGDVVRSWSGSIVPDGSLPDSGFEVCTAPASGDLFCRQISEVCAALNAEDAEIGTKCGYHVHVDASDFRYFELRRLILLYARIEPALFGMVPRSRRDNTYCRACGPEYLAAIDKGRGCKASVVGITYGTNGRAVADLRKQQKPGGRYRALNLHSWFYRGTIECRLAAGSTSADKIICWGILWAGILDAAYRMTEHELRTLPRDPLDALLAVAPTDEVRAFIRERSAKFA